LRRSLLAAEERRRQTGNWGTWERIDMPDGAPLGGWGREVRAVAKNQVFAVLLRPLPCGNVHAAVSSLSGKRPTWHEMQRIKSEIFGKEATAVEIYPPDSQIVDEADMFHIWSVDPLPFSIWSAKA
jgi:hypothetical protein